MQHNEASKLSEDTRGLFTRLKVAVATLVLLSISQVTERVRENSVRCVSVRIWSGRGS
jgi:hypothetical protein